MTYINVAESNPDMEKQTQQSSPAVPCGESQAKLKSLAWGEVLLNFGGLENFQGWSYQKCVEILNENNVDLYGVVS